MSKTDYNPDEERVDELLASGLANYSNVEPLSGIEDRILRRLEHAQDEPAPWHHGFTWSRASWALTALLLVAGLAAGLLLVTAPEEDVDYIAQPTTLDVLDTPVEVATAPLPQSLPLLQPVVPRVLHEASETTTAVEVKQAQFPAPAQFSEQERLALAYARTRPVMEPPRATGIAGLEIAPLVVEPLKVEELARPSLDSNTK